MKKFEMPQDEATKARRKAAMGSFHQRMANAYRQFGLGEKVEEVKAHAKKHGHKIK